MKSLVVWFNPNKNKYYYKVVYNFNNRFYVGFQNQYKHIVILVIDIYKELVYKEPLLKMVLSRVIGFLQKIYKRI